MTGRTAGRLAISAAACIVLGILAGCGGGGDGETPTTPSRGGTLRLATASFAFDAGFDPVAESTGFARALDGNLLLRTLVTYRHRPGPEGAVPVADLAKDVPAPADGGTTFTFKLKQGIRFGPPLRAREITSKDVAYAFERIATGPRGPLTESFDVIEGLRAFRAGTARSIRGIQTPDDKTITFKLVRPTGDFLHRLALPAAAPVPREIARCFPDGGYGRHIVASGPYMVEGADRIDPTACATLRPLDGFDPADRMILVRNPAYDPATDDPSIRAANVDRVEIAVLPDPEQIFARIERGELDGSPDTPPVDVVRRYAETPTLVDRLTTAPGDTVWYVSMNLTVPPFDDVHVRRAVNHAIDKARLVAARGGPVWGVAATHVLPNSVATQDLSGFDPYPFDLERAADEMRRSRYDADGDGRCDHPTCRRVVVVSRDRPEWRAVDRVVGEALSTLGIDVVPRVSGADEAYATIGTVAARVPLTTMPSWSLTGPDPEGFMRVFSGTAITPTDNVNHSLVGLTPRAARRMGVRMPAGGIPSVDREIATCARAFGDARLECWSGLDRTLMGVVVPWVPYLVANHVEIVGPALVGAQFDEASGEMAYAHVGVDPARQRLRR